MVSDDQIWKLTFHAQAWHLETGPDENCRCALATAPLRARKGEKFKQDSALEEANTILNIEDIPADSGCTLINVRESPPAIQDRDGRQVASESGRTVLEHFN